MGFLSLVKHTGKKTLALAGLEVHRVTRKSKTPNAQGMAIKSAAEHNTLQKGEEYYSNPRYWKSYIEKEGKVFYPAMIAFLREKNIDCNGKRVLDAGCGTGHLLLAVSEAYRPASLTGFEVVPAAMRIARDMVPRADIRECNIENKIDKEGKFDVLFCTEVLEHILTADEALLNILSIVNDPGVAVVTVPNGRIDTFAGHLNYWSPESWGFFIRKTCPDMVMETGTFMNDKKNYAIIRKY